MFDFITEGKNNVSYQYYISSTEQFIWNSFKKSIVGSGGIVFETHTEPGKINHEQLNNFINQHNLFLLTIDSVNKLKYYCSDNMILSVRETSLGICTLVNNEEDSLLLKKELDSIVTVLSGSIYTLNLVNNQLSRKLLGINSYELIHENYTSYISETYQDVITELNSKDPSGRLLLLAGEPGTGKTYYLRSLMNKIDGQVIIIQPDIVAKLATPSYIEAFQNICQLAKTTVLAIEDADVILLPRGVDNLSGISALLNFTDGILGAMFDIKIICSHNTDLSNVDKAIMRPGRLLYNLQFNSLSANQANIVYSKLSDVPIDYLSCRKLAEIYYDARLSKKNCSVEHSIKKVIGF